MTFVHMSSWTVASLPLSLHDCDIVSARSPGVFPGPRAESVLEHSGCVLVRAGKVPIRRERKENQMGKIVVSDNVSLDGVVQDPAGDEGFRVGGWVGLLKDRPELNRLALDEALSAEALLLGRRRYEWFGARWPCRTGEVGDGV